MTKKNSKKSYLHRILRCFPASLILSIIGVAAPDNHSVERRTDFGWGLDWQASERDLGGAGHERTSHLRLEASLKRTEVTK
jgi:hypothetical protein